MIIIYVCAFSFMTMFSLLLGYVAFKYNLGDATPLISKQPKSKKSKNRNKCLY